MIIFQVFEHNNNQEYTKSDKLDYKSKRIFVIDIENLSKVFCNQSCLKLLKNFVYIYFDFEYLFVNNNIDICEQSNNFFYFIDN